MDGSQKTEGSNTINIEKGAQATVVIVGSAGQDVNIAGRSINQRSVAQVSNTLERKSPEESVAQTTIAAATSSSNPSGSSGFLNVFLSVATVAIGLVGTAIRTNRDSSGISQTTTPSLSLKEVFKPSTPELLPDNVAEAPKLLDNFKQCLGKGDVREAKKTMQKLENIIVNDISTTGSKAREFAWEFYNAKDSLKSIALFDAAASLHKYKDAEKSALTGMSECVSKMHWVCKDLPGVEDNKKRLVREHVINVMRDIHNDMEKVTTGDEKVKCRKLVQVLGLISQTEDEAGKRDKAEKTFRSAEARLKKTDVNEAEYQKVYSEILNKLNN